MSNYVPWRPGDKLPVPRFGLDRDQWERVLIMHAAYPHRGPMDRAQFTPTRRLEFAKYLVQRGIVNEGQRQWKV